MSGIYVAKGKDRSVRIELFLSFISGKGDRPMVAASMAAGITSECRTGFALLTDFTRFSHERRSETDHCKFSRNKRNQRLFERNLDSTQRPCGYRSGLARISFLCSIESTYITHTIKFIKYLYHFLTS